MEPTRAETIAMPSGEVTCNYHVSLKDMPNGAGYARMTESLVYRQGLISAGDIFTRKGVIYRVVEIKENELTGLKEAKLACDS